LRHNLAKHTAKAVARRRACLKQIAAAAADPPPPSGLMLMAGDTADILPGGRHPATGNEGYEHNGSQTDRISAAGGETWSAENLVTGFDDTFGFTVELERLTRHFHGETEEMRLRATSVYRREDGAWKVVHRHGDSLMTVEIDPEGRR
jgi:ketosteroid isomerase-like protein